MKSWKKNAVLVMGNIGGDYETWCNRLLEETNYITENLIFWGCNWYNFSEGKHNLIIVRTGLKITYANPVKNAS